MGKYSEDIIRFKKHFQDNTDIKVIGVIEDRTFFHWKRLILPPLNYGNIEIIKNYINRTFYVKGKYYHLSPTIGVYNNQLTLTIDVGYITKFIK